ncbi:MAG: MgtC/SapB family protein [Clostridia bacterium]|nr:MgtC/SapB family protein [Clostridia bacterium]
MVEKFLVEYKYLLAILLSVVLGFLIGLERKTRAKEAGVRTHTIVCFGACLLMIISKYGFSGESADVARVAAQIVSGIGFIGAGMIVYRKNSVHGLTTAAGVWATAGIGMACGAGLYFVAVGGTLIMILVQCVLHINCKLFNTKHLYRINISFIQTDKENERIKEIFNIKHFQKLNVVRGERTVFNVSITTENEMASDEIDSIMKNNDFIISIERCDD